MFGSVAKTSRANVSRSALCAGPPGGDGSEDVRLVGAVGRAGRARRRVAQHHRAPGNDTGDPKPGEFADFEGQQPELLVDRDRGAERQRRQRRADRRVRIQRRGRLRHLHGDKSGQGGRGGHQNPFADFYIVDLLPADDQKGFAAGQRQRFARFHGHALPLERLRGDGRIEVGVSLGRQRDQHHGDAVAGVLVTEERLARHQSRRGREPDPGAGRIVELGGGRRQCAEGEHEQDEEPAEGCHAIILPRLRCGEYGRHQVRCSQRRDAVSRQFAAARRPRAPVPAPAARPRGRSPAAA